MSEQEKTKKNKDANGRIDFAKEHLSEAERLLEERRKKEQRFSGTVDAKTMPSPPTP